MNGKNVVVTGATSGIGRVAAERIAAAGAAVTLVARNEEKASRAAQEIREATGNERVDVVLGDLSVLAEVRRVAAAIKDRLDAVHVLVNNAGAMFSSRAVTEDGFERTFALNHLAYFVLTRELLPLLEAAAPSRVVSVASEAHKSGRLDLDDLAAENGFSGWRAYASSKLANIQFTRELARRLDGTGVTANCVHPGFVRSGFGKGDSVWLKIGVSIAGLFARTPEEGAEGIVYLSTSPHVEDVTGRYFMDHDERRPSRDGEDDEAARHLWEVSERVTR